MLIYFNEKKIFFDKVRTEFVERIILNFLTFAMHAIKNTFFFINEGNKISKIKCKKLLQNNNFILFVCINNNAK